VPRKGNIHTRLETLEERIQPPDTPSPTFLRLRAVLDELASLKSSCAVHYRGGTPMVRIEPENIPRKLLGPGYTHRELHQLACERASGAGAFDVDEIDRLMEMLDALYQRPDWDEPVQWEQGA
jgi:hypothetical protein